MLQAVQFEISPYANVKLDSSAGLKKFIPILKFCLWLEQSRKISIISNIYTRTHSMDFDKTKQNTAQVLFTISAIGTLKDPAFGIETQRQLNFPPPFSSSLSPPSSPIFKFFIQQKLLRQISLFYQLRQNKCVFFLENTCILYIYIQGSSCFPYVKRFACGRQ